MAFDRSFPQSLASPVIAASEHFWPSLRFSPLRLKNAASFGSRDYDLRLPYAYSDTLPTSGGRTLQFAYGYKLSLTAALSLTPTPPAAPTVSARYRSAVNPMPPLAIPSRRCRSASFLLPFTQCIFGCTRHSQASLPLLSFARKFARKPYCQPRSSHPQRKKPPTFQAPGISIFFVCDAMPTPGPDVRCADALTPLRLSANHFTHSESAYGLGQGQVGLLSAVQAPQQKACRSVPPRHLPFALILCRHSEFPTFLWLTSLTLRAASSSPHIATSITSP